MNETLDHFKSLLAAWKAPKSEQPQTPTHEKEEADEPELVAEYLGVEASGEDRTVRLLKTKTEQVGQSAKEHFLIQADVEKDENGTRTFVTIGERTSLFNPQRRLVNFEDMHIDDAYQGQGLGSDAYKAFVSYANRRATELDGLRGSTDKGAWTVTTVAVNPAIESLFKKYFVTPETPLKKNGMYLEGVLRPLQEIETEEQLAEAKKEIEKITAEKKAA